MVTAPAPDPLAYRPREAARAIGLSYSRVKELLARGEIASFKTGDSPSSPRLIRREALVDYLDRLEQAS